MTTIRRLSVKPKMRVLTFSYRPTAIIGKKIFPDFNKKYRFYLLIELFFFRRNQCRYSP